MRPVLFELFGHPVHAYGVMLLLAFAASCVLSMVLARRVGLAPNHVLDTLVGIIICALIGSRLPYLLADWRLLVADPSRLLRGETLQASVLPGIAAAIVFTAWSCRRRHIPFLPLVDVMAAGIALGIAIGRIGCALAGCCHGSVSDVPWAVTLVRLPGLRHPAPLYETALALAVMGALLWWLPRRRFAGEVLALFFVLYGGARFCCELFRDDSPRYAGFTVYQYASLAMMAGGGLWMRLGARGLRASRTTAAPTSR